MVNSIMVNLEFPFIDVISTVVYFEVLQLEVLIRFKLKCIVIQTIN